MQQAFSQVGYIGFWLSKRLCVQPELKAMDLRLNFRIRFVIENKILACEIDGAGETETALFVNEPLFTQ